MKSHSPRSMAARLGAFFGGGRAQIQAGEGEAARGLTVAALGLAMAALMNALPAQAMEARLSVDDAGVQTYTEAAQERHVHWRGLTAVDTDTSHTQRVVITPGEHGEGVFSTTHSRDTQRLWDFSARELCQVTQTYSHTLSVVPVAADTDAVAAQTRTDTTRHCQSFDALTAADHQRLADLAPSAPRPAAPGR